MLEPIMSVLGTQRIVLASSSPRRHDVMKMIGLKFDVIPSLYEEDLDPSNFKDPKDFVIATAENKVKEVEERLTQQNDHFDMIIGADTIVYMGNKIHGKPKSEDEAYSFLQKFSNNHHFVHTGVIIRTRNNLVKFSESTKVYFGNLSEDIIRGYLKKGIYKDKAGGYGIQDIGATLIEKVEGDYFNVVGLPVHQLCKEILKLYSSYEDR